MWDVRVTLYTTILTYVCSIRDFLKFYVVAMVCALMHFLIRMKVKITHESFAIAHTFLLKVKL